MNSEILPLVSIGMTVYNGERFLEKSILSLLEQDYNNIELIICDNCSQDSSGEICLRYEASDPRVKYIRNIKNIGAAENFNLAFYLSSGEYFMWASDHDLWDKSFISGCIEPMINDESIVLSYGLTVLIDKEDKAIEVMPDRLNTVNLDPEERFSKVMLDTYICNSIYGLMRTSAMKRTGLIPKTIGSDHVFLAELSLYGPFNQIEKPLFYRREDRDRETEPQRIRRVMNYMDPDSSKLFPVIWANMAHEHINAVKKSPLTSFKKEKLINQILKFFQTGRFSDYINLEIEDLSKKYTSYFGSGKLPSDFSLSKLIAAEALQSIATIIPFASKKEIIENMLFSCRQILEINQEDQKKFITRNYEMVSVIIPAYNRAHFLPRAIKSVLAQTMPVNEIIIVDDGSTDSTESLIDSLKAENSQISYIKLDRNSGAQAARNIGIKNSNCEWIGFLDSDDEWLPNRVELSLKLAAEKNVNITHCECLRKELDKPPVKMNIPPLRGNIQTKMLQHPASTFPGLFLRKICFETIGLLDEKIIAWQEWDTYIRLAKYFEFAFVEEPLFIWHWHADEAISKSLLLDAQGYYQVVEKHKDDIVKHAGIQSLVKHYLSLADKFLRLNMSKELYEIKNKLELIKSEISSEVF